MKMVQLKLRKEKKKEYMLNDSETRPMLTVRDVARLLNVHCNTVRRWSDRGILRAYRITRRGDRRFRRDDVTDFLAELNTHGGDERKTSLTQAADVETSWERFISQIASMGGDSLSDGGS